MLPSSAQNLGCFVYTGLAGVLFRRLVGGSASTLFFLLAEDDGVSVALDDPERFLGVPGCGESSVTISQGAKHARIFTYCPTETVGFDEGLIQRTFKLSQRSERWRKGIFWNRDVLM